MKTSIPRFFQNGTYVPIRFTITKKDSFSTENTKTVARTKAIAYYNNTYGIKLSRCLNLFKK